jgi:hypothetical protein
LPTNWQRFDQQGLSFYYPLDWVFQNVPPTMTAFMGQIQHSDGPIWSGVLIRRFEPDCVSPDMAVAWDTTYWKSHGIEILRRRTRLIAGYQAQLIDLKNTKEADRYEAHAYFGARKGQIYTLQLLYDRKNQNKIFPVFTGMLDSVHIAP